MIHTGNTKTHNPFNHLMIDIETMGNESFSSIVSIGAVEFILNTGQTGRMFYANVDLQSCMDIGLTVNASTVMWWLQQNQEARDALCKQEAISIKEALIRLSKFIGDNDYQVWANSPRFDCGILHNAYSKLQLPLPWDFRKERCVRTLASFAPEIRDKHQFQNKGTAHNALEDCKHQIRYCSDIWRYLNSQQHSF